jgi:hypothetical protein
VDAVGDGGRVADCIGRLRLGQLAPMKRSALEWLFVELAFDSLGKSQTPPPSEQAAQIQKVSAQLEVSKPAPQTVLNNQKSCVANSSSI